MKRLAFCLVVLAQAAPGPATPASAPIGGTIRGNVSVVRNGSIQKAADAWVYLEEVRHRGPRGPMPGTGITAEIRQKGKQFVPHVLVIPTGATVAFPNYDDEEHNVFSPTDPPGQWDLGRYNTDHKGHTHHFELAEEIDVYCDIHKEMWAKVKVVDSAFIAAVTNGKFELANVPPGTYKVIAWTPNSAETKSSIVKLQAVGDVQTIEELHVEAGEAAPHHRKDGSSYGLYKP